MNCQLTYEMTSKNFPIFPNADPKNPISIAHNTYTHIYFYTCAITDYRTSGDFLQTLNKKMNIKSQLSTFNILTSYFEPHVH
jgi:hypothetical protein